MKKIVKTTGSIFAIVCMTAACSVEEPTVDQAAEEEQTTEFSDDDLVTIPVALAESSSAISLLLAPATDYDMTVDGCASGLTTTANELTPSLEVYKFDRGCLAKLTAFTSGGITYVPSSGDPFTTWLAGDTATFEDQSDPTTTIAVKVDSQLEDPIAGTETVAYSFSEIEAGADENIASSVVGQSQTLSVSGQVAPDFNIATNGVNFVGITATGAGEFEFKFECASAQTGTGLTADCAGVTMSDLTYKLVEDTFGGTLTTAEAAALFPAGESSLLAAEVYDAGTNGLTNGGFTTKLGTGSALVGPDAMHDNPNMILILQAADTSYKYFNIDVSTLSETQAQ